LEREHGVKSGSGRVFIDDYRHLCKGESFPRGMSAAAMRHFIGHIAMAYGRQGLENAVMALRGHIQFNEKLSHSRMHLMRAVAEEFGSQLAGPDPSDEHEKEGAEKRQSG
jgi:hypothetical protein